MLRASLGLHIPPSEGRGRDVSSGREPDSVSRFSPSPKNRRVSTEGAGPRATGREGAERRACGSARPYSSSSRRVSRRAGALDRPGSRPRRALWLPRSPLDADRVWGPRVREGPDLLAGPVESAPSETEARSRRQDGPGPVEGLTLVADPCNPPRTRTRLCPIGLSGEAVTPRKSLDAEPPGSPVATRLWRGEVRPTRGTDVSRGRRRR